MLKNKSFFAILVGLLGSTMFWVSCQTPQTTEIPTSVEMLTFDEDGSTVMQLECGFPFAQITNLGLITPLDSSSVWKLASQTEPKPLTVDYEMISGKRRHCTNEGYQTDFTLTDNQGHTQRVEVRCFKDGIAFRYVLAEGYDTPQPLLGERTHLQMLENDSCARWIMRWRDSYEDFYPLNPDEQEGDHWGYPALFSPRHTGQADDLYVLLTEASIEHGHAASNFYTEAGGYHIQNDRMSSVVQNGFATPWRVLITGKLNQIVESTLVTDLSPVSTLAETEWIDPGVVSWIYWAYNHGSNDYDIVCQYVDMAQQLGLPYVLIDAEWDEMPEHSAGNQSIEDALAYAREKGVKPMIWYNSTTGWIDGAPTPQYRLNDPEKREKEFAWLEQQGVVGVKIDFFEGDTEDCMNYCIDLLESAAKHHLLVNFHGATIPRGWMRTYPHLLSTEAVYGAEWYNNKPALTNKAAAHNATLPFTRGVVGSMDYTPCTFTDSQHPHITSHAHELALTVLYESALQHLADRPSAYLSQPQEIRDFFASLPTVWDDTRLVTGYPAHHAVLMRRHADDIYVAGINGTDEPLTLDLSALADMVSIPSGAKLLLIEDNPDALYPAPVKDEAERWYLSHLEQLPQSITLAPRGGFVLDIK